LNAAQDLNQNVRIFLAQMVRKALVDRPSNDWDGLDQPLVTVRGEHDIAATPIFRKFLPGDQASSLDSVHESGDATRAQQYGISEILHE